MKHVAYVAAAAVMAVGSVQAQMMVNEVEAGVLQTTEVQTDQIPTTTAQGGATTTYTTVETTTVGAAPTVDPGRMATLKLEDGSTVQFPDSADKGWQEYAREKGYDRFTFDPESGLFVVGKGDAKFEKKWDDNGNRIPTPVAKPKRVKKVEEPVAEAPAEAPAEAAAPVETPTEAAPAAPEATEAVPAATTGEAPAAESAKVEPAVEATPAAAAPAQPAAAEVPAPVAEPQHEAAPAGEHGSGH